MILFSSELKILGLLINHPEKFADQILASLHAGMFTDDLRREMFVTLKKAITDKEPVGVELFTGDVDQLTLAIEAVQHHGFSVEPGPDASIRDIQAQYAQKMTRKALIEANKRIDEGEEIGNIWSHLSGVREDLDFGAENKIRSIDDLIHTSANIDAFEEMSRTILKSGIANVDSSLLVRPGSVVVIAGRPSMGKTDIALMLGKGHALAGGPVGVISLEMKSEFLLHRLAIGATTEQGSDYDRFIMGCQNLQGLPMVFDDCPRHDIHSLRATVKRMVEENNINFLVIDYLTLLDMPKGENTHQSVAKMSREIKVMAVEFNLAVMLVCQLNRAVEQTADKRPSMSHLRESGAIEQDADIVLLAYRPHYYGFKDLKEIGDTEHYLELIIAKQRGGRTGRLKLFYDKERKILAEWEGYRGDPQIEYKNTVGF